jgi:hypothetical protein
MTTDERKVTFREREFKGSRLRCLLLTCDAPERVAAFLKSLVFPHAQVTVGDHWAPRGLLEPDEAKLGEMPDFVPDQERAVLTSWWLKVPGRANTPNWDLVSTCRIAGRKGLVLVEAKAHEGELADDKSSATSPNREQIEKALVGATAAWNALESGFLLSVDSHYQLSNRLAFSWKLATMGIPVVLVYLGFLGAREMDDGKRLLLKDHAQWRRCVMAQSIGTAPNAVWDRTFDVGGTPLTVLIRSAIVRIDARLVSDGVAL